MNYYQLTENERYQIGALLKAGHNQKEIAGLLGRSPSTVSREIRRNRGLRGYRPKQAQRLSSRRRSSAHKAVKLTPRVRQWIELLLRQELSPQQVCRYLQKHQGVRLHHETIYQLIYADKAQGGDLYQHLRIMWKAYRTRYGHYDRRGTIPRRTSIEDRPGIVDQRARIGDWEADTVIGKGHQGVLLTLVERKTLYTLIVKLPGKQAQSLAQAAINVLWRLRDQVHTITFDNGLEFAHHQTIANALDADTYFAHPYASWERGTNENTNGLIRQYLPKGISFRDVTDEHVQFVISRLNNRPRASRNDRSPNELFMGQRADLLAAC